MMSHTEGEALASQQPAVSRGGSKVRLERVALLFLAALLGAAVIVICRLSEDNIQTKRSFNKLKDENKALTAEDNIQTKRSLKTLKDENEALKKNLTETLSKMMVTPFCPQTPEPEPSDASLKCDAGWEQHLGKCYYFSITYSSWEESRCLCQRRGGDLVKIDSSEEQEFLNKTLGDIMRCHEDKFWIGLTDSEQENKWIWVDGSPLNPSLSFWLGTEPDNWKEENPEGEDCVRMGEKGGAENLKCWFDKSCNHLQRSICEKPAQTGHLQDVCLKSS